jgi:hypothetical protein
MKRLFTFALLACVSLALSGAMVGCSASGSVDTPNDHDSSSSYKKTTYRDANGNVTETKTTKTNNP